MASVAEGANLPWGPNRYQKNTYSMKSRILIPAAALLTSCALALSASAEETTVTLKQSLPVGKKILQSMVMNQKMKMGGVPGAPEGGGMNMTNKITMDMSMDITKHEKGKKMVLMYDRMAMLMDAGVFKQEFDSEDKENEANPFQQVVGKPLTLIYNEKDEIESVEGAEGLLGDAANTPGVGDMLTQLFGEEQLKQTMNQMMVQMLPDKPLKIGDSWDYTMDVPMPAGMGKMKMSGKYTLKKFDKVEEHDVAVLGMVGKLITEGKTKMNMQGQELEMEFKNSQFEGDIYFDNKLGLARKTDMLTTMDMAMVIPGLGQEMTIGMNMNMNMKVTQVEDTE